MQEVVHQKHIFRFSRIWVSQILTFSRKKPVGAAGAAVLLLMVLLAVLADVVSTHDHLAQNAYDRLQPPTFQFHLFGTDSHGRDMYSRVVYGSRISMYVGLVSVTIGTLLGSIVGILSAYIGGKYDLIIQRFVDTLMGFPGFILALVLVVSLGASLNNVVIAIAATFTPRMVRLARASALSIKEEVYVLAAQSIGASTARIVFQHIFPNSLAPIFVMATAYLGAAIVIEASLSFLGLGVPPPHPSWGRMLQEGARGYLEAAPWLTIFPGLALTITVFGFSLFGDALRDALDPRLRTG